MEGDDEPRNRKVSTLVETLIYKYMTTKEEMVRHLVAKGINLPNFAYDFEVFK